MKFEQIRQAMANSLKSTKAMCHSANSRPLSFRANFLADECIKRIRKSLNLVMLSEETGFTEDSLTDSDIIRFALEYTTKQVAEYEKMRKVGI